MFYGLMIVLLLLDLFTKHLAETRINPDVIVQVIPDWLSWRLIHNTGASFGLFAGHFCIIVAGSMAIISFLFYLYLKSDTEGFIVQATFALILSGAIGNLVNRMEFGYVTDFIQFRWWPAVFNVADMEIRTGVLLLVVLLVTNRWKLSGRRLW